MIDLSRIWPVVLTVIFTSLCVAACRLAIGATPHWWPAWLQNDWAYSEIAAYGNAGPVVSALLGPEFSSDRPMGIVIGTSTMDCGIDQSLLESQVVPHRRWFGLTGIGASTCELDHVTQIAISSGLVPEILVVCLDLKALARSDSFVQDHIVAPREHHLSRILDDLSRLRVRDMEDDIEACIGDVFDYLFPSRDLIGVRTNARLTRTRYDLLQVLGQNARVAFPPLRPSEYVPWSPSPESLKDPDFVPKEERMTRRKGAFTPELYSPQRETSQALVRLIRTAQSAGSRVVILVMPESSEFRPKLPAEALSTFSSVLEQNFRENPPTVLMLRAALADDHFFDHYHLNPEGKRALTNILIRELNKLNIPSGQPLG